MTEAFMLSVQSVLLGAWWPSGIQYSPDCIWSHTQSVGRFHHSMLCSILIGYWYCASNYLPGLWVPTNTNNQVGNPCLLWKLVAQLHCLGPVANKITLSHGINPGTVCTMGYWHHCAVPHSPDAAWASEIFSLGAFWRPNQQIHS